MDWEPITQTEKRISLAPQTFFPEEPSTGLEALFMSTLGLGDSEQHKHEAAEQISPSNSYKGLVLFITVLVLVTACASLSFIPTVHSNIAVP